MAKYTVTTKGAELKVNGRMAFERLSAANQFYDSLYNVLRTFELGDGAELQLLSQPMQGSLRILKEVKI